MKVLVSGGAGYIGRVTCKILHENGFCPVTIDNLIYGDRSAVRWGPFYEGNIKDTELVQHILLKEEIKGVIHLAASISVGESVDNPLKYYENNLTSSIDFIGEIVKNGIENFIFSSSCAVYGEPTSLPVREDHHCQPVSVYGSTKLSVENLIRNLTFSYPFKSISFRYFNVAGAHQDLGETRHPPIHLIPSALQSLQNPQTPLHVYGNQYPTPDGSCIRDYVHVEDISLAHVLALKKLLSLRESKYNNTYNLGSGRGYSVFEVIRAIEKISQQTLHYDILPPRKGDPANLVADFEKARRDLGWEPKKSDLETIIRSAYDWSIRQKIMQPPTH
jgi:UDP-glucose-4-epimerase GalE